MAYRRNQTDEQIRRPIEPTPEDAMLVTLVSKLLESTAPTANTGNVQLILWQISLGLLSASLLLFFITCCLVWMPLRFVRVRVSPIELRSMLSFARLLTLGVGYFECLILHWEYLHEPICIVAMVLVMMGYPLCLGIAFLWKKGVKKVTFSKSSWLFAPQVTADQPRSDPSQTAIAESSQIPELSQIADQIAEPRPIADPCQIEEPSQIADPRQIGELSQIEKPSQIADTRQIAEPSQISEPSLIADPCQIAELSQIEPCDGGALSARRRVLSDR